MTKVRITAEAPGFESREHYLARARELVEFLEKRAIPALNEEAAELLRRTPVWISAERIRCAPALSGHACVVGETTAPEDGKTEYKISLSLEMFLGPEAPRILAHELFHVVQHALDPAQQSWTKDRQEELGWFREGMAQLFEYMVSRKPNGANMQVAFENLETPLMASYTTVSAENYGHDFLYFFYIWRECGGDELFKKFAFETIAASPQAMIERALTSMARFQGKPQCTSFAQSAYHFELARVLNHAEDGVADENRHLLWPSRFNRNYLRDKLDYSELVSLPLFKPVVIAGDWRLTRPLPPGVTRTWLHLNTPYRSQIETPSREAMDSSWVQVFLRVSDR